MMNEEVFVKEWKTVENMVPTHLRPSLETLKMMSYGFYLVGKNEEIKNSIETLKEVNGKLAKLKI